MAEKSYGTNGVAGVQHNDVLGWEKGTVGPGGSVKVRLNHSQGLPVFDPSVVAMDEPLRTGRFLGLWLRPFPYFNSVIQDYWNYFFQDKLLEVSGLNDNAVAKMSRQAGANKRTDEFAGNYQESNGVFTLRVPEVKGSPVRKVLRYTASAISDRLNGNGHLYGREMRFVKPNYSGDFFYCVLGPSMRPDDIEFACIWFNAFPTPDYLAHMNSGAIGEPGEADRAFDVEFAGTFLQCDEINQLAKVLVEAAGLYKDTHEDVILPSYVYQDYFNADLDTLRSKFGIDMATRLSSDGASTVYTEEVQAIHDGLANS